MTKRRITILVLVICALTGWVVAVSVLAKGDRLHAKPRREWKEQAIAVIERRMTDRPTLQLEIDGVTKTSAATRPAPDSWAGENVLVMKNGDWIAYESICSKEDSRIHDLFIGRGSDGKWYYSTFHFCVGMTTLRQTEEWQPESLAQFANAYLLVPFDGRSDESLKETWTGVEAYGLAKVQMAGTAKPSQ